MRRAELALRHLIASALMSSIVCVAIANADAARPDFTGLWQATRDSAPLTVVGGEPPLTMSGAQLWNRTRAATNAGDRSWDTMNVCLPPGTPRAMSEPYPLEILQEPNKITVLFQLQRLYRTIPTDGHSNATPDPTFMGISTGSWNGDELVIETSNFKTGTFINDAGLPHSEKLKVIERWKLSDARTLTDRIRIEDPDVFTAPWDSVLVLKRLPRSTSIAEDVCVDRVKAPLGH